MALALLSPAAAARADSCPPPGWVKVVEVKRAAGELAGLGKGATVTAARKEARRSIAAKLVQRHFGELLALPAVKGSVNRKVYAKEDLARGLALAVALNLTNPKRLQAESVCGTSYVAYAVREKTLLAEQKQNPDLGEQMNLALTGHIEELEAKRAADEDAASTQDLATPEGTVQRLKKLADGLDREDLLEVQFAANLRRRADRLEADTEKARALQWPDRRAKAVKEAEDYALASEKIAAAAREIHKKDYVAAFEMLNTLASAGDETAQFAVGYMQAQALGVKRDYKEAMGWLRRSAAQNFGPAKMLIGILMFSGRGMRANPLEGAKWIDSATADGWSCQVELTMCRK